MHVKNYSRTKSKMVGKNLNFICYDVIMCMFFLGIVIIYHIIFQPPPAP